MILKKNKLAIAIAALAAAASGNAAYAGEVAGGNASLQVKLSAIGRYDSGFRNAGGAEIVQYDAVSQRLFAINAATASVDVLDIADPTKPTKVGTLHEVQASDANSVAVFQGLVAVVFGAPVKTDPGRVVFYNAQTLERLASFQVGALPDMVTFMPDGGAVLVANEAEPNAGYTVDPEGSVSVIDLRAVQNKLDSAELQAMTVVRTAGFQAFNPKRDQLRAAGIRIYGPPTLPNETGATVAQDLEPEYIAVAHDGQSAWVTLQEANAVGVLDLSNLDAPYFSEIIPLGLKDHSLPRNKLDASDRDNGINIRNWPVKGMYQPDAVASYAIKGQTYYVLANEGDDRNDFIPGEETIRVGSIPADKFAPEVFGDANAVAALRANSALGRLTISNYQTSKNAAGQYTALNVLGGRSFSIRSADGKLLYDSGSDFEDITAQRYPFVAGAAVNPFNSSNDNNNFDDRSDNKGPEPEGVALGKIRGRTFAFVGLERVGGIMTYDVTDPTAARFVDYVNTRNFSLPPAGAATNDVGPEGVAFISADESPTGKPLVVVGHEISGTTVIFSVEVTGK